MKYQQSLMTAVAALWLWGGALGAQQIRVATSMEAPVNDSATARARVLLAAPVSMSVVEMPLQRVIDTLAAQANAPMVYRRETVSGTGKVVTLHVTRVSLSAVLDRALAGTSLRAVPLSGGRIGIVEGDRSSALQQTAGVRGRVVDAKTKQPLRDVVVTLDDSGSVTRTNEEGWYHFTMGTAGAHRVSVRAVGYARQSKMVAIVEGQSVEVDFVLESTVNTLDQVVVTATGEQRIRELGHVVARINADSLVREAPITDMTELLQSRIPGLQVLTGSGGVAGGSSEIRIRGQSSITLKSEPIVIVDGVRYKSDNVISTSDGDVGFDSRGGNAQLRSPLNDLNPNDIETIEVVKGPSAATLYGPEASNGVIVVTTKHGKAGKTEWHWYAHPVSSDVPEVTLTAAGYKIWAHDQSGAQVPYTCLPYYQYKRHNCFIDSVTIAPTLLAMPGNSILSKNRPTWQYGVSAGGGASSLRYFVSGNYDSQVGSLQVPPNMQQQLKEMMGVSSLSDAIRNPNTLNTIGLHSNLSADVTTHGSVGLTATYTQVAQRRTDATSVFSSAYNSGALPEGIDSSSFNDYLNGNFFNFGGAVTTTQEDTHRLNGAVNGTMQFFGWLTANAAVGIDVSGTDTHAGRPAAVLYSYDPGYAQDDRRDNLGRTITVGATALAHPSHLSFRSSLGAQYAYTKLDGLTVVGYGLAPGSASIGSATEIAQHMVVWNEQVTLGIYGEEVVGLNDRLFLNAGLRVDGATTFGNAYHPAALPKVNLSWIASDEPLFRHVPGLGELRFRYAYGTATKLPTSGMKLGGISNTQYTLGGETYNAFFRSGLANPQLHPERSRESEWGADATIVSGTHIGLTWYTRRTLDELTLLQAPTGIPNYWANTASVAQHGFEATVSVPLVNVPMMQADAEFSYSFNTSNVLGLGDGPIFQSGNARIGYPLDAIFGSPTIGVVDTVSGHPPTIVYPEEIVTDTAIRFLGVSTPPRTYTLTPTVTILHGHLRLSALFDHEAGAVLLDDYRLNCISNRLCLAPFLASTPPLEQAKYLARNPSDFYIPGDFTRWREVNATFDIPPRFLAIDALHLRFSHASVSVQGRNLALWTRYTGTDPESRIGPYATDGQVGGIPQARAWSFRFDLTP